MGSFNVACSISNLSIDCGVETVYLPIFPSRYNKVDMGVGVQSMLTYPYCYFSPLTFPIKGEYNDYGNVEELQKDVNTEHIEEFFGISIEEFLAVVSCARGNSVVDGHDDMFRVFAINNTLMEYKKKFDDAFMLELGFVKDGKRFKFGEFQYTVELVSIPNPIKEHREKETGFVIYDKDDNEVVRGRAYDAKKDVQDEFFKLTGWHINVSKENQTRVKILQGTSGMYIIKSVYDGLVKSFSGEGHWGAMVKENGSFEQRYDKAVEKMKENESDEPTMQLLESMRWDSDEYFRFYGEWTHFKEMYWKSFAQKDFKAIDSEYRKFYYGMYSANRFFFPAMNGEQCGNLEAEKVLARATIGAINAKTNSWGEDLYERKLILTEEKKRNFGITVDTKCSVCGKDYPSHFDQHGVALSDHHEFEDDTY